MMAATQAPGACSLTQCSLLQRLSTPGLIPLRPRDQSRRLSRTLRLTISGGGLPHMSVPCRRPRNLSRSEFSTMRFPMIRLFILLLPPTRCPSGPGTSAFRTTLRSTLLCACPSQFCRLVKGRHPRVLRPTTTPPTTCPWKANHDALTASRSLLNTSNCPCHRNGRSRISKTSRQSRGPWSPRPPPLLRKPCIITTAHACNHPEISAQTTMHPSSCFSTRRSSTLTNIPVASPLSLSPPMVRRGCPHFLNDHMQQHNLI